MILIDNILVDEKISKTHFDCDLNKCKGACCTFPGDYGAPLLDEEVKPMEESLQAALPYLSKRNRDYIEENGFYSGSPGDLATNCINKRDCVFVYYEGDIAFCALEKAYREGKTKFQKPVSCHLFPIRVGKFGGKYIYYEKISECNPALEKGRKEGKKIYHSVKDALVRSFGEKWYNEYVRTIAESEE